MIYRNDNRDGQRVEIPSEIVLKKHLLLVLSVIACIYTIIETARMNGINPQAYLADVLARIADHPIQKIDALLPWLWTK